jgi:hypothetical protein
VLLGVPGLVPRLEKLQPSLFEDGRAIRFNFYELGRDEIDVFTRRQLRQSSAGGGFAVDEINWIADLSSGDPAQVNRLSLLRHLNLVRLNAVGKGLDAAFAEDCRLDKDKCLHAGGHRRSRNRTAGLVAVWGQIPAAAPLPAGREQLGLSKELEQRIILPIGCAPYLEETK